MKRLLKKRFSTVRSVLRKDRAADALNEHVCMPLPGKAERLSAAGTR